MSPRPAAPPSPAESVWDLVVGHDEQVTALREAIAGDRVTHAWLFTGPPGIGKLHTARVFAAALNCPSGGDGTCETCRRILRGVHPDVHLIVPEGDFLLVEEVRAVREEASRSRREARTAVFIFDEADRMTEAAANALLKVLEEPPANVVFVLVARSPEALVGTVPSRARTVPFVPLSLAELGTSSRVVWLLLLDRAFRVPLFKVNFKKKEVLFNNFTFYKYFFSILQ